MYRKHFGLTRLPFDKEIASEDLYSSSELRELQTRLRYLLELRGLGLITGEPGTGKTAAMRKTMSELHPGQHRVFYVPLSTGNVMDLYKSIAWQFGLPTERSRAALYRTIQDEVTRLWTEAKVRSVLVIDEAQHLRSDLLEDLRLLTNYEMDSQNRLTLLFLGQVELRRRLSMAVHEALNQRIVLRHHLTGLNRDELVEYLRHHLRLAGTELMLFDAGAIEAIFQATNGVPRKINMLAHHALMAAAIAKCKAATPEHVETAREELS
jgi:type II secretory pathway predicted ATPase ExeA